ncbi:MAG TPA: hypothetical protein VK922_03355 [Gemmatimonadaceae bacterium]|nr:hypothetical protein [Gemmatimonadaceae bacterium]
MRQRPDLPTLANARAARIGRGGITVGAALAVTGVALEWLAPLWPQLPAGLRTLASLNEPILFGGLALMLGGAIVARRFRGAASADRDEAPNA